MPSQRSSRSAISATAPSPSSNETRSFAASRQRRGELAADLGGARVRRGHRQHAGGRGLGGDHPERLREGAREDQRVAGRDQLRDLVVLEPPREGDARRRPRSPTRRSLRAASRGTRRASERRLAPRPRRRPRAASSRSGSRSPGASPSQALSASSSAPNPTTSSRASDVGVDQRPGREQQVDPLLTISLPTKTTRGPSPAANHSTASAASDGSRPRRARQPRSGRRGAASLDSAAGLVGDGGESGGVDPRRAEADLGVRLGVVDGPAQAFSDVGRADEDAVGSVAGLGVGPERSRSGRTV